MLGGRDALSDFLEGRVLGEKTMMSYSHSPGPCGMSGDVVIHGYTFMARTPRAGSFIIDWIKMQPPVYHREPFSQGACGF